MQKKIYLIWDKKLCCVYKATTNSTEAYREIERLNATERFERFTVKPIDDFADKH